MIVTQYSLIDRLQKGGFEGGETDDWCKFWAIYAEPVRVYAEELIESKEDSLQVLQVTMDRLTTEDELSKFKLGGTQNFLDFLIDLTKDVAVDLIIRQLRNEDPKCNRHYWCRLEILYKQRIVNYASRYLPRKQDCEDIAQVILIWLNQRGLSEFDRTISRFDHFLFKVVDYRAIDLLRKLKRENSHISIDTPTPGMELPPKDWIPDLTSRSPIDNAELKFRMKLMFNTLNYLLENGMFLPNTVDMFKAVTLEERKVREVANAFGTTEHNVHQAKHTVLAALKIMVPAIEDGLSFDEALALVD